MVDVGASPENSVTQNTTETIRPAEPATTPEAIQPRRKFGGMVASVFAALHSLFPTPTPEVKIDNGAHGKVEPQTNSQPPTQPEPSQS